MIASVKDMVAKATAQLGSVTPQEAWSELDTGAADPRVPVCPETETSSPRDVVLWRARHRWATLSVDIPCGTCRFLSVQYTVGSEKW